VFTLFGDAGGPGMAMVPKTAKKPVDGEPVIKNSNGSQPQIEDNNIIITRSSS